MSEESRAQRVSLGCGTLILIALIVLIFSNRGADELEREVHGLRTEIGELKVAIESQTDEIILLRKKLDKQPEPAKDK